MSSINVYIVMYSSYLLSLIIRINYQIVSTSNPARVLVPLYATTAWVLGS